MVERGAGARSLEREAHEAYTRWISSVPWSLFCTWTVDKKTGPDTLLKAIFRWIRNLERDVTGHAARNDATWPGVGWVVGLEQHTEHVSPHGHGLLVGAESAYLAPHWQRWKDDHGRGRFERVDSSRAVAFYCTKYAVKERNEPDFRMSPNFDAWLARGHGEATSRVALFGKRNVATWVEDVDLETHVDQEHGGRRLARCSRCRALGARGHVGVDRPEVDSDRVTTRPASARSVGMGGELQEKVSRPVSSPTRARARCWWSEGPALFWTLRERGEFGETNILAAAYRELGGGWYGQRYDVEGAAREPYADWPAARAAIEAAVGLSRAA